jgi:hypothetical protein
MASGGWSIEVVVTPYHVAPHAPTSALLRWGRTTDLTPHNVGGASDLGAARHDGAGIGLTSLISVCARAALIMLAHWRTHDTDPHALRHAVPVTYTLRQPFLFAWSPLTLDDIARSNVPALEAARRQPQPPTSAGSTQVIVITATVWPDSRCCVIAAAQLKRVGCLRNGVGPCRRWRRCSEETRSELWIWADDPQAESA